MDRERARGRQVAYYSLWATQMRQWSDGADSDVIAFIRQRECARTVKWLVAAGIVNMGNALHRFEVDHCKTAIQLIPHVDQVRPGRTTWAPKEAKVDVKARPRVAKPPPLPPRLRRPPSPPPPPPPGTQR